MLANNLRTTPSIWVDARIVLMAVLLGVAASLLHESHILAIIFANTGWAYPF